MLAGRESVAKKRTGGPLQKSTIRYRKACYILGRAHEHGVYLLCKDATKAAKWYRKMQSCSIQNCTQEGRDQAAAFLRNA